MNKGRSIFNGLDKIRFDRFPQNRCHSTANFKIFCINRLVIPGKSDQDISKSFFQVIDISGQSKDSHDLTCSGNYKPILTWITLPLSAESYNYISQTSVIHIHCSLPEYLSGIKLLAVRIVDMIVQYCREKIMGSSDRMNIACEVKVDIHHRENL